MQRSWHTALRRAGIAVSTVGLVFLAACGGSSTAGTSGTGSGAKGPPNPLVNCPASTQSTAATAETGQITLNVTGFSSSPAEDALVKKGLADFSKANPTITVNWSPIPDQYETKLAADISAGSPADVFYVTPSMAQQYIPSGKLLNLSPYMSRDNVTPSTYYDSLMQPFACKDGTMFSIPKDWNTLGMVYNKDMLAKAGITTDPNTWTWDDLKSAAQKLTGNGVVGASLPSDASRWGAFVYANGGTLLSSDGKTATFNSQAGLDAAKYYSSFQASKIGARPADLGAGWDGEAFGKGLAAITFEGGWMIPYMTSTYPKINYGIAELPKAPSGQRGNLIYTNGWGAYSGTKHADAAWKVIQYMTGPTYEQQVLQNGFALPTNKSLANDPYFSQNPNFATLLKGSTYGHADFYGLADKTMHDSVANALDSIVLKGVDPKKALDDAANIVNTFIVQNQAP